jgi:hypothetical protein
VINTDLNPEKRPVEANPHQGNPHTQDDIPGSLEMHKSVGKEVAMEGEIQNPIPKGVEVVHAEKSNWENEAANAKGQQGWDHQNQDGGGGLLSVRNARKLGTMLLICRNEW